MPICACNKPEVGPDQDSAIGGPAKRGLNGGQEEENRRVELARPCGQIQFIVLKLYFIRQEYNSHVICLSP